MFWRVNKKLLFLMLLISSALLFAQDGRIAGIDSSQPESSLQSVDSNLMYVQRINGPVNLDGFSNEPAWEGILPVPAVTLRPDYGSNPSEKTEMLIAYDENYIYVAGRLYQGDPSKIQANSQKRDSDDASSDWFGIAIDSFNDNENVVAFYTTPAGLRWDASISNDFNKSSDMNVSWNTFWDVKTQKTDEGWFVEMRIPFSSLRFQTTDGRVLMGIHLRRDITFRRERIGFPAIPQEWQVKGCFKASLAQKVVFENLESRNPFYITPYVKGGYDYNSELNEKTNSFYKNKLTHKEFGVDIKYGITNNLTLDVTLNTDFAQIEADDQQVNLTRYSLFFPEKRMFFQERAGIFDFNFESGESNRLFHSRRIGINNGKPVRIYGGARIVGRVGKWDLGALNMQTEAHEGIGSENFGVMRIRRQVINPYSYVGGILTSRIGDNGNYNIAYGVDGIFRLFGNDYLTVKTAQTYEKDKTNKIFSLENTRVRINWQRRTSKGFGYAFSYSRAGAEFNPGIGFEMRHNFSYYGSGLWYGWYPDENSSILTHRLIFNSKIITRNSNGAIESANAGLTWDIDAKLGSWGMIKSFVIHENVPETFSLSDDAEILPGKYTFFDVGLGFDTPYGNDFYNSVSLNIGTFYDGWKLSTALNTRINISSSMQLSGNYQFNKVSFPNRGQYFNAHIIRIRAMYMLNTEFSVSAFIQYSNIKKSVAANFRLRYNPSEGQDFYLVYNESLNTDRYGTTPRLPFSNNRTVLLKYTYTLSLF